MHLTLSPMCRPDQLTLHRVGDVLTVNGEVLDFTDLPEGATLPRAAVACDWLASDVTREGGVIRLALVLPHGSGAPHETRFPAPLVLTEDGPVNLPPYDDQHGIGEIDE